MKQKLKSPFVYFGGKAPIASTIWDAFGDADNYIEPFFGSGAVLLSRPGWAPGIASWTLEELRKMKRRNHESNT